ncbi:MAG: S1 family peptidase [Silvanigrellaceae bacterium]
MSNPFKKPVQSRPTTLMLPVVLAISCSAAQSIVTPSQFCTPKQDLNPARQMSSDPEPLNIVGGQPANNLDKIERSAVAIQVIHTLADGSGNLAGTCTAVVAAKNVLITAAHCFAAPSQPVSKTSIGVTTKTSLNNLKPTDIIGVAAFKQHPQWNGQFHDIAVVQLQTDLPPDILPATFVEDVSTLTKSTPVVLIGYGITGDNGRDSGTKRRTDSMLDKIVNKENFPNTQIVNQIRVLDTTGNARGACFGDSGGPGYIKQSEQVFGIVQGINETVQPPENMNCSTGDANYTLIAPYRSWIEETAKITLNAGPASKGVITGSSSIATTAVVQNPQGKNAGTLTNCQ